MEHDDYEEPLRNEGRFSKEVPGMGADFEAFTLSQELAENFKIDFSPRERRKYAQTLKAAARVLEMVGVAVETESDPIVLSSTSLINMFLLSTWIDFVGAVHENVEREARKAQKVEEQVRATLIPDTIAGLEGME